MQKPQFEEKQFYHIYNRGVEKRNIFLNDFDYLRFIHDLFEFNDIAPAGKFSKGFSEVQPPKIRKELVKIHCFCLMPNHYHFILEQQCPNGIVKFMRKIGTGYTMYFNQKYSRTGHLFQGRFKAVQIKEEPHFLYLPLYIHLNPLDLSMPEWRKQKIRDRNKAFKFLESYRWSSHLDYLGRKNFPSVIFRRFLDDEIFCGATGYERQLKDHLEEFSFGKISDIALE